jgi:hypothetical protein
MKWVALLHRPLVVVEAEHRVPKGWFVGRTTTCD